MLLSHRNCGIVPLPPLEKDRTRMKTRAVVPNIIFIRFFRSEDSVDENTTARKGINFVDDRDIPTILLGKCSFLMRTTIMVEIDTSV